MEKIVPGHWKYAEKEAKWSYLGGVGQMEQIVPEE